MINRVSPLLFDGYRDFSLGRKSFPVGQEALQVPVMLWHLPQARMKPLKTKPTKSVELLSLPDVSHAIRKRNKYASPKLAEVGAVVLNRILGFEQLPDAELAVHPGIKQPDPRRDLFVLQEFVSGMTLQDALQSKEWRPIVDQALDDPKNLFPLYLQMVISGDSDRHNENLMVDKFGKLWSVDFEYSGGHDFYTYENYESFTTDRIVEERLERRTPFPPEVCQTLDHFIADQRTLSAVLNPYYGRNVVQGMFERARILRDIGRLLPTPELFPLIRHTFYRNDPFP